MALLNYACIFCDYWFGGVPDNTLVHCPQCGGWNKIYYGVTPYYPYYKGECPSCGKAVVKTGLSSATIFINTKYIFTCNRCGTKSIITAIGTNLIIGPNIDSYWYSPDYVYYPLTMSIAPVEYPCPQCGAIFYSQPELDAHIQQEHPPPVEYPCPQCGAIFYSQADLDTHIQQFHPEIPEEIPTWLIVGSILALSLITVMIVRR